MVKGKISGIIPKTWNEKKLWEFTLEENDTVYTCWQDSFAQKKVGEEAEFEVTKDSRGELKKAVFPFSGAKGGYSRGKSPEEIALQKKAFALSYAKDQSGMILDFLKDKVKIPENLNFTDSYKFVASAITHLTVTVAKDYEAFLDKKPAQPEQRTEQKFADPPAGYKGPEEKPPWA